MSNFTGLMAVIAAILISILITAAAQWLMNHINNKITYRIVRDLRVQAFNHLQTLPLSYVDSHSSGDLLSRIITDIDQFSDGLLLGFTQLFTGVITIVGTIVFMLGINPLITLVVVVLSPMSFLIANFIAKKLLHNVPTPVRDPRRTDRLCQRDAGRDQGGRRPSTTSRRPRRSLRRSTSGCPAIPSRPLSSLPLPTLPPGLCIRSYYAGVAHCRQFCAQSAGRCRWASFPAF